MQHENQSQPVPTDEIASLAGRILARRAVDETSHGRPGGIVSFEKFNSLLADAKKLAGYVLNADPCAGPNRG